MRHIVLRGTDLVKYESGQRVLDYYNLSVYAREILGIVGLDESGIATLAGILEGKIRPDGGNFTMQKKRVEISSKAALMRQGIFSMSHYSSLIPLMSVLENICAVKPFVWKDFFVSHKKMEKIVVRMFDRYGLNIPLRMPVCRLSRLEQDMVEICRAVLYGAKVLVLYEISEGYTNREWKILQELLRHIRDEGISVVFMHSDLKKILEISDRVQVIARGFARTEIYPDDYTDDLWKVLYQSEQFYVMHKTLEKEKPQLLKERARRLQVKDLILDGLAEPVTFEVWEGMTAGIVASDGLASQLAQILGGRKKGEGRFVYKNRIYSGRDWKKASKKNVAYVGSRFWKNQLFYNMTIGENIVLRAYPRFRQGFWLDKKLVRFAVKEYCRMYDLDENIMGENPQNVGEESLKEIFWVRMAVAPPELLVMDEPFYAMDEAGRLYMHKYMKILKEKKCAIVICGKNQREMKAFCDKIYNLM